VTSHRFVDGFVGEYEGVVDDVVLRRNDGVPSYNIAVVVDDALQSVSEVVRGDDLLSITATQMELQRLLGLPSVSYRHVPLVVGVDGERLAKRHGAVTVRDLVNRGMTSYEIVVMLNQHCGVWNGEFSWSRVTRGSLVWTGDNFVTSTER
jgi:glutamyl-tRNA synthetase